MYVRMTLLKAKPGRMGHLRNVCVNDVVPACKGHMGIRFVHLFERMDATDEDMSVTAGCRRDLEACERNGAYQRIPVLLGEVLTGALTLKPYEVTASSEPMILRIF
jgi:hypothetical protein